jgi:uncharacterized membrane protein
MNPRQKVILSVVLVVLFCAVLVGVLFQEDLVRAVQTYFVEPFVTDTGYNAINTITWILILFAVIYIIDRYFPYLLKYINLEFFGVVIVYLIGAAELRVLEDASLFQEPLSYVFVTPMIDVFICAFWVPSILFAYLLLRSYNKNRRLPLIYTFIIVLGLNLAYLAYYLAGFPRMRFGAPPWVFLLSTLAPCLLFYLNYLHNKKIDSILVSSAGGIFLVVFSFSFLAALLMGSFRWVQPEIIPWFMPVLLAISGSIAGAVAGVAYLLKNKYASASFYLNPINLLLIFGQMLDAAATSIGIDQLGYAEKHWIPGILVSYAKSAGISYPATFVMMPIKFVLVVGIIFLIDYIIKTSDESEGLGNLLKVVIFMVGFGPGLRDCLRITLQV